ncbi:MAG: acyl-CoA thioesterase [Oscillospiraceae bacterium]|jgi:acyl-CoA hydrolase|nr:acyl-CoA thioesterase [Oscillospiraceae bacterium]
MQSKKPADSEVTAYQMVMPSHLNGGWCLFGGQLMSWIDLAAGAAACRHSGGQILTAACEVRFLSPARTGDLLKLAAKLSFAGESSMEVLVRVSRGPDTVALARVTLVAVDNDGRPRPTPSLLPCTEGEKRDYAFAQRRYLKRKQAKS